MKVGIKIIELINRICRNILMDLEKPVHYAGIAVIVTAVVTVLYLGICWIRKGHKKGAAKQKTVLAAMLASVYFEVLLQMTFLGREPGCKRGIDWKLFETWGHTSITHALFIENIMLFMPFGFLMPMVFEKMQKLWICVAAGFVCSCMIEFSQLLTQRGFCQVDDVMTNTFGTLLGWLVWKCLDRIWGRHKKR